MRAVGAVGLPRSLVQQRSDNDSRARNRSSMFGVILTSATGRTCVTALSLCTVLAMLG